MRQWALLLEVLPASLILLIVSALWLNADLESVWREVPANPEIRGIYAANDLLSTIMPLAEGAGVVPEGIAFDEVGHLFTGYQDG